MLAQIIILLASNAMSCLTEAFPWELLTVLPCLLNNNESSSGISDERATHLLWDSSFTFFPSGPAFSSESRIRNNTRKLQFSLKNYYLTFSFLFSPVKLTSFHHQMTLALVNLFLKFFDRKIQIYNKTDQRSVVMCFTSFYQFLPVQRFNHFFDH